MNFFLPESEREEERANKNGTHVFKPTNYDHHNALVVVGIVDLLG